MNLLIFEDAEVDRLDPLATGRPAWAISCASYRLIDLVRRLPGTISTRVRPFLQELIAADYDDVTLAPDPDQPWTLCLNARIAPTMANYRALQAMLARQSAVHVVNSQIVHAALLATDQLLSADPRSCDISLVDLAISSPLDAQLELFEQPYDCLRINTAAFRENLDDRLQHETWHEVGEGVFCGDPNWRPPEQVVVDPAHGVLLISAGVRIQPFAVLGGPLFLGPDNQIAAHSSIRNCVATGRQCKLGGEIESCTIEGYSNKQHYGFLGNSYLGSWVNLGAGTCNSNLKNTYGTVTVQHGDQRINTGELFVGCLVGDYAKTAINTSIFTGKAIGACSMVYGMACRDVAAFTNHAATVNGEVTAVDPQVMINTQARMFERRNISRRDCDRELITAMFDRTARQRQGLPCRPIAW